MKRLSDYTGDEAIELWVDLLAPISAILGDAGVKTAITSGEPKIKIAQAILKKHKSEATEILLRIDSTPLNGFNVVLRIVNLLAEIGENEDVKSFFGFAEQVNTASESQTSVMENTEESEN